MGKRISKIVKKIMDSATKENLQPYLKELLWAETFNSTITDIAWLQNRSFSPGRWAVGYPGLYILVRTLNEIKPESILEFGLGESSKITSQYVNGTSNPSALRIVEHDENWISFFCKNYSQLKVTDKIMQFRLGESVVDKEKSTIYKGLLKGISDRKYDFVIIDGPFGSDSFSRPQILDIIKADLLMKNFVILFDDAEREGEQQTIKSIKLLLEQKGIDFAYGKYTGMKDTDIICSKDYQFLISL
ncbi:hypothetical protein SLH46_02680 [Draconibacterium sp. IB214405]|uniref:hypothetical protein n=1 Tax=Draconibacterium sp. IB214405 TaxID=3097352 RepID=UPI002A10541C|nr:hypothetical protein [Draconibacterium sp. IB214405]MDX8338071.1 hypothetical protein [Draconibacterium sp. IB214405]